MLVRTVVTMACAASLGLLAGRWQASEAPHLHAHSLHPLHDADDDMLPDTVEWVALTNPQRADTDQDGLSDFVEVVQNGSPRRPIGWTPLDHEMRVLVSSSTNRDGSQLVWFHLLARFMGTTADLRSLNLSMQVGPLPGIDIPLDLMALGPATIQQRSTAGQGLLAIISVPVASESLLRLVLPCNLLVEAQIGHRHLRRAVHLFDTGETVATLVPYDYGTYGTALAVQSLGIATATCGGQSNKICVLQVEQAGETLGGGVYRVRDASCDDCNDLECGTGCLESSGWVFVLPGLDAIIR